MPMIHDHCPLWVKRLHAQFEQWYTQHYVMPHFESLGSNPTFMRPWHIDIHGAHICAGDNLHIITAKDRRVSFSAWQFKQLQGHITLGHNCLVCPGVRFDAGSSIQVGDNCMFAANSYITDADWHDIYDRTQVIGQTSQVKLGNNVWLGDNVTICKGVNIGENSVIGAGAIVVSNIPANCIAAGNPAKVVKILDPTKALITRASIFEDVPALQASLARLNQYMLHNNTLLGWLRTLLIPRPGD